MKTMKVKILIATLAASAALCSCHGDLNVVQPSQFTSASMWTSESDFNSAINGMYSQFRVTFNSLVECYGDYRTNLYGKGKISNKDYDFMALQTLERNIEGTNWADIYTTINYANLILKHSGDISFASESNKNNILANAYFVRAYCYFTLARVFGDVPLLTSGFESDGQSDINPTRTAAAEVFAQVESDLTAAGTLLTTGTSLHKASPAAINMLKADYYLWKAKCLDGGSTALNSAKTAVDAVLNNSSYQLQSKFSGVFGVANESNSELIFTIVMDRSEYTGGAASLYLLNVADIQDKSLTNNPYLIGSHAQYVSLTDDYVTFLKSDSRDSRFAVSYIEGIENAGDPDDDMHHHKVIIKFPGEWINETRVFSSDIIIYRLAEANLMKAEIENALGNSSSSNGALFYLNRIAKRAYGVDNYYTDTSNSAITTAIVDETLKEFVAEGKSWWTMIRNGQAFSRISTLAAKQSQKNILLWPVADACMNTNPNIVQTEGWN